MKKKLRMPVGIDNFQKLRQGYYFVDKTSFIRDLIDGHSEATLITRPRRFGKTLTLSMLHCFFTIENAEENRKLFDGCGNVRKLVSAPRLNYGYIMAALATAAVILVVLILNSDRYNRTT
ncbi:MAG: AAA family ATPase, partial [Selenomonadaceae bacterium]|nr:AAA family ATPase [Selenomonadaceae bacterium]